MQTPSCELIIISGISIKNTLNLKETDWLTRSTPLHPEILFIHALIC